MPPCKAGSVVSGPERTRLSLNWRNSHRPCPHLMLPFTNSHLRAVYLSYKISISVLHTRTPHHTHTPCKFMMVLGCHHSSLWLLWQTHLLRLIWRTRCLNRKAEATDQLISGSVWKPSWWEPFWVWSPGLGPQLHHPCTTSSLFSIPYMSGIGESSWTPEAAHFLA